MCGIVGYLGKQQATPILLEGLKRLEYRGYDSCGLVVLDSKKKFKLIKTAGRIADLEKKIGSKNLAGILGCGHTRWATHGAPTDKNAHPHSDCSGKIWVVHNGIIENYQELKKKLVKKGHKFKSETDSEVLAHMIESQKLKTEHCDSRARWKKSSKKSVSSLVSSSTRRTKSSSPVKSQKLEEAVIAILKQVIGTYGIVVISQDEPQKMVVARQSSPLLIGIGVDEYVIASDASAIITHTKKVVYLDDNEIGVITPEGFKVLTLDNQKVKKEICEIDWDIEKVQKGGHPHFMLKEIFEQSSSLENSLRGRLIEKEGLAKLGGLENIEDKLRKIERLIIVGCGTSYFAGLIGEYMLEEYAGIPTEVEFASEFRYRKPILDKKTAAIFISQSGETADTISALKEIKRKGGLTLGIVNAVGSSVARESKAGIYNHIGPEIGVASTKAFTSQLAILSLFTLFLARQREMSLVLGQRIARELKKIPEKIKRILVRSSEIKKLAKKYKNFNNFLFLGRKYNYPIALEGALKLKEISYIHAEGYGAGEMKHGPIALIDENFPTIAICPSDSVYDKMISNIQEIKARKGKVIAVATEGDEDIKKSADDVIYIPKTLEMLTPILSVIPLQLLAYYTGVLNGKDPDFPRNLAKAVSVE